VGNGNHFKVFFCSHLTSCTCIILIASYEAIGFTAHIVLSYGPMRKPAKKLQKSQPIVTKLSGKVNMKTWA